MSDVTQALSVDEKFAKLKALVVKSFTHLQNLENRLTELEEINQGLVEQVEAMNDIAEDNKKYRNIRAKPEALAFARYLLDREDFTLQEVDDSGVLSYNRAYGLSQWSQKHFDEYAASKGVTEHYTQGDSHPDFPKYVLSFAPKHRD